MAAKPSTGMTTANNKPVGGAGQPTFPFGGGKSGNKRQAMKDAIDRRMAMKKKGKQ